MNKKEALEIIANYNPPKPTKYYYKDPYDDGKFCGSGWRYDYPPVDPKLIDAILERDKDCKEYIPDSESYADEKFNQEVEKRFTDLMSRAKDTAVEEYRKNNSHLYSMVTEYNYDKITVIPKSLSTLCEFKERCEKAASEIGLKNFYIHKHEDDQDVDGKMVYGSSQYGGLFINDAAKNALNNMIIYCNYFKKHAKDHESLNRELISNLCDDIHGRIESLYKIINVDYLQRTNNYTDKDKLIDNRGE